MAENKFNKGDEVRLTLSRELTTVDGVVEYATDSVASTPLSCIAVSDVYFSTEEKMLMLSKGGK